MEGAKNTPAAGTGPTPPKDDKAFDKTTASASGQFLNKQVQSQETRPQMPAASGQSGPDEKKSLQDMRVAKAGQVKLPSEAEIETYKQELKEWGDKYTADGYDHEETTRRIIECYRNGSAKLDLSNLKLAKIFDHHNDCIPPLKPLAPYIQQLDLSDNADDYEQIGDFIWSICDLAELRELRADRCGIEDFYNIEELKACPHLRFVSLQENNLSGLPAGIGKLSQLREIHFEGNEMSIIASEDDLLDMETVGSEWKKTGNKVDVFVDEDSIPDIDNGFYHDPEKVKERLKGIDFHGVEVS